MLQSLRSMRSPAYYVFILTTAQHKVSFHAYAVVFLSVSFIRPQTHRNLIYYCFCCCHNRYRFGSANVLRTLKCIIKALYKEQADDKSISDTLLSLDTLYEMVLSHSQFLEIILSDKQDQKRETKGRIVIGRCYWHF